MREPPDLSDDSIVGALQAGFGIRVAELPFSPVGNDADSWAYRIDLAQGPSRFLKVRAGAPYLVLDRFALALYPVVDAGHGAEVGLSPAQWRQFGAAPARVHATPQTPELTRLVGREAFRPSRRELLRELEAVVAGPTGDDPVAGELAAFWQAGKDVIDVLVDRADRLGRQAAPAATRQAAVEGFKDLFEPGNIVELALGPADFASAAGSG